MADRKITELDSATSTDWENDSSLLHLVNPSRTEAVDRNRRMNLAQAKAVFLPDGGVTTDKLADDAVDPTKTKFMFTGSTSTRVYMGKVLASLGYSTTPTGWSLSTTGAYQAQYTFPDPFLSGLDPLTDYFVIATSSRPDQIVGVSKLASGFTISVKQWDSGTTAWVDATSTPDVAWICVMYGFGNI